MSDQSAPMKRNLFDVRGLPWWQIVLALAPIVLIFVGGLVGGVCAVVAILVNIKIARGGLATPAKALTMIAVDVVAAIAWFFIAAALFAAINS